MEALEPRQLLASLAGEVWSDLDADGVRDATEPGAANVRVYDDFNNNGMFDEGFETEATTNVLGQYVLENLLAGTHVIRLDLGSQQIQTSPRTYFGTGYTAIGDGSGNNPTQLFSMGEDGSVMPIGSPTTNRIHGLIRTNDGVFFGVNADNDTIYTINGDTGQETFFSSPGTDFAHGLAYDPSTDKIYAVGREGLITNVRRLYEVNREDGTVTPIGNGLTGLDAISDLTFDTENNRIVGFDNNDDQFFAFDLAGNGTSLSTAQLPIHSWSLAFNGQSFVMFDQNDPDRRDLLEVDPDTGAVQLASFEASARIPSESLFYATSGDVAQRVTVLDDVVDVNFGVFGEGDEAPDGVGPQLGGLYINELMTDPLFGNNDTDQFIEIRGDKGALIPENTYLVIIDDDNSVGSINRAGEIHGIFDLGNQALGPNGFLVLLQQNAPYQVNADATVLQSDEVGFGGLPGDIYSDLHDLSERIDFILGPNTFMLIQSDVPPALGADIDVGDDGVADPDGVIADWTILDSISIHPDVFTSNQAYGQIVMVEDGIPSPFRVPEGATVVTGEGSGYAARVGDSIGSDADDWLFSTVRDEVSDPGIVRYGIEDGGVFGLPTIEAFKSRDLDHVGESNFVGGVRGHAILEPSDPSLPPDPAPGVTVFADENGNQLRDNLLRTVEPDDFPAGTRLENAFPGVTISTVDFNNEQNSFDPVTSQQQENGFSILQNRHFWDDDIDDTFSDFEKLRFDFYRPANTVSIVGIAADFTFFSTIATLEAYDADGNLLGTVSSNPLISGSSQGISLNFQDDVIAYALAYGSSVLGARFDTFSYRQFEAADITDENGFFEITPLFPNDYRVTFQNNPQNPPLQGAEPVPIVIQRYDNLVIGPNDLPVASDLTVNLDENSPEGTFVGQVEGSDGGGTVSFAIAGDSQGILINEATGEMFVGPEAELDFEETPEVTFLVGVSDLLTATTFVSVTVELIDLNETPIVTADPFFIAEDTEPGTSIGQIQAFDPDFAQDQDLQFEVLGGSGVGILEVGEDNGIVTLISSGAIDFETQDRLELIVRVSDNGVPSLFDTIEQTIIVVDSNDPPVLLTSQVFVNENETGEVDRVQVTDPDVTQTHQFILAGGDGAELFNVESDGTVVVRPGAVVDFEQNDMYTLNVTVVDSGAPPLSDTAEITVRVFDINEPAALEPTFASIPENSEADTPVATLTVIDPEGDAANQSISLVDGGENFDFDSATGELTVAEGADLDFESQQVHELVFEIVDSTTTESVLRPFVVTLTNGNDAPVVLTQQINVSELAPEGSAVAEIRAVDVDGDRLLMEITGGTAADLFDLNAESGVLTVADGVILDAEAGDDLTLDVRATDPDGLMDDATIRVVLNDVNEPPVFGDTLDVPNAVSGSPLSFTIPEDFVTDPEGGIIELTIFDEQGELPDWLTFDSATRTLSGMPNPTVLGQYELTLRAFEPGPLELGSNFQFQLNTIAGETPLNNQRDPLDVDDNSFVVASDALRVLNYIAAQDPSLFFGFVDVNGNGVVTSLDALVIINDLTIQAALGEAELVSVDDDDRESAVDAVLAELGGLF